MLKILKVSKNEINLPIIVIIIGIAIIIYHIFSYLIPVTNNAFVATNVTPIAADVSGYITKIYVTNGQKVKKNDPLLEVYPIPYWLDYKYAKAKYEKAIEELHVIDRETQKTRELYNAANFNYEKIKFEYDLKNDPSVIKAVAAIDIGVLNYKMQALEKTKISLKRQIAIEDQRYVMQQKQVNALKAAMQNAKVYYNLTTVRAPTDGIVDNMYISLGTPVKQRTPLFSFIDTTNWWIQANFNETDLRHVRPGDEAYIVLRMYYFNKVFHGRIVNTVWASDRQHTVARTQQQKVTTENEWLLIPQRLPLQIKILDPDPNFPLQPGASAYVYVKTHTSS
jgi:multidrug resistance efflux pump